MKKILIIALIALTLGACNHSFTGTWVSELVAEDGMARSTDTLTIFPGDSVTMTETFTGEVLIPMGKADSRIDTTETSAVANLQRLAALTGSDSLNLRLSYAITVITRGHYAIDNGNIRITFDPKSLEATFSQFRFPDLKPEVEEAYIAEIGGDKFKDDMALQYLQMNAEELAADPTLTLVKPSVDGNRMTATVDGETITFSRKP